MSCACLTAWGVARSSAWANVRVYDLHESNSLSSQELSKVGYSVTEPMP